MGRHKKFTNRQLKKIILLHLQDESPEKGLAAICELPARQAVNPLFSYFCSTDAHIKWRAVSAMGVVVARLAETELESARVVMRRFIWNLNDESGGIGWGCPEAMGEVMTRSQKLAAEYSCILVSYIQPDGNYLEHELLQRGVLWGIGRLAHARPNLLNECVGRLHPFMRSKDPYLRGLAVWAAGPLAETSTKVLFEKLRADRAELQLYRNHRLLDCSVAELAKEALAGK